MENLGDMSSMIDANDWDNAQIDIAKYIKNSKKTTPTKLYITGNFDNFDFSNLKVFGEGNFRIIIGELYDIKFILYYFNFFVA